MLPLSKFLPRRTNSFRELLSESAVLTLAIAASMLLVNSAARGALPANDNAGNYNGSGQPTYGNGANAGTGFQPFSLFSGDNSGDFLADFNPAGSAISSPGGKVFDTYGQYGGFAGITRSFTAIGGTGAGTLSVGNTLSFRLDLANTINSDGNIGFTIESSNNQSINFAMNGGNGANQFSGSYGTLTGISLDTLAGGVAFSLTVDSARQFTITAQGVTNGSATGTYTFTTGSDLNLTGLTIYDYNSGPSNDLFFNDLSVTAVPEPATCFAGIGSVALLLLKMRRRRGMA